MSTTLLMDSRFQSERTLNPQHTSLSGCHHTIDSPWRKYPVLDPSKNFQRASSFGNYWKSGKDPFRNHPISGLHSSPTGKWVSPHNQQAAAAPPIWIQHHPPNDRRDPMRPPGFLCFLSLPSFVELNRLKALLFQYGCNLHASSFIIQAKP